MLVKTGEVVFLSKKEREEVSKHRDVNQWYSVLTTPKGRKIEMVERSYYEYDGKYRELGKRIEIVFKTWEGGCPKHVTMKWLDFLEDKDIDKFIEDCEKKYPWGGHAYGYYDAVECY